MRKTIGLLLFLFQGNISPAQLWSQWGNNTLSQVELTLIDSGTNELYAGNGMYLDSNGNSVFNIGRWNGAAWHSLGPPDFFKNFFLTEMIFFQDTLYVSGRFQQSIYKFDGNYWQTTNSNTTSGVDDIIEFNGKLWACGYFYSIGGVSATYVAYFDSVWHSLPDPGWILGGRFHFVIYNSELYVFGNWGGGDNMQGIIKWNGLSWDSLGQGIHRGNSIDPDHLVNDAVVYKNELYVAGDFDDMSGNPGKHIARWDRTDWHTVGLGANNYIHDLQVYHDELYVTGAFTEVGDIPCWNGIAKWDGNKWCCIDDSIGITLFVYQDSLCVSGNFNSINGQQIEFITQWVGGNHTDTCSLPIGISETQNLIHLNCFPNPSDKSVTLSIPNDNSFHLRIYDLYGKELFEDFIPRNSTRKKYDISNLSPGIYFVMLQNEVESMICRILKK